jgi:drug/metabolite transporter (DMT)-like permease
MTQADRSVLWPGVPMAVGAAVLFGAMAPFGKVLLGEVEPQLLAGLLYLGAGIGLAAVHLGRAALGIRAPEAPLRPRDLPWLAAVILFGGVLGPFLLMLGLARTEASSGSLLLNLETLFTMGIAWLVFRELSIAGCCSELWRSSSGRQSSPGAGAESRWTPGRC